MITSDIGFWVDNYVGTYHMEIHKDRKIIVSNEYHPARDGEDKLEVKRIFVDDFRNNEYLLVELANVNMADDSSILGFCNKYGLPYSSAKISDEHPGYYIMGLDVDERTYAVFDPFYRQDSMTLYEFGRHHTSAQRLISVKAEIESKSVNYINLFRYLMPLLLYERIELYDYNEDDPERFTDTMEFQYYFLSILNKAHKGERSSFVCEVFDLFAELQRKKRTVAVSDKFAQIAGSEYITSLLEMLREVMLLDTGQLNEIGMDEYNNLLLPDNFQLSERLKNYMKRLAGRIFSDMVNEGLCKVHPKLMADTECKIVASWDLKYQFEGMLVETLIMTSGETLLRKCANPTCWKFYTPNASRRDKKYCSHECAVLMAKRRQREKDKTNPDRKRMEPGFQGRKNNPAANQT